MNRLVRYAGITLLTCGIGAGLALLFSSLRAHVAPLPNRVAPAPGARNADTRCLDDIVYVWEEREDVESGVVDPFCAGVQMRLLEAALAGDAAAAGRALDEGANPDAAAWTSRDYHETQYPLVRAAAAGHTEIVRLLLDAGAQADREQCCCMNCRTPLAAAADGGHAEVVRLLVARGANVGYRDRYDGKSSLAEMAERRGDAEIARLLRARGE